MINETFNWDNSTSRIKNTIAMALITYSIFSLAIVKVYSAELS